MQSRTDKVYPALQRSYCGTEIDLGLPFNRFLKRSALIILADPEGLPGETDIVYINQTGVRLLERLHP